MFNYLIQLLNLLHADKLMLDDFVFNNFRFENLISIFSTEQQEMFTQTINNAIISKIYKELKLISEDKILTNDGRLLVNICYKCTSFIFIFDFVTNFSL